MKLLLKFKKDNSLIEDLYEEEGYDLRYFEEKAGELHTEVDKVNQVLSKSMFHIETTITGDSKNNHYKLKVKVSHYEDRKEHEHKKNTHRQEIDI